MLFLFPRTPRRKITFRSCAFVGRRWLSWGEQEVKRMWWAVPFFTAYVYDMEGKSRALIFPHSCSVFSPVFAFYKRRRRWKRSFTRLRDYKIQCWCSVDALKKSARFGVAGAPKMKKNFMARIKKLAMYIIPFFVLLTNQLYCLLFFIGMLLYAAFLSLDLF